LVCVCEIRDIGDYSIETEVPGIFPFLARRALACRAKNNLSVISRIRIRYICQCHHPCLLVVCARDIRRQQGPYKRKDADIALELLHQNASYAAVGAPSPPRVLPPSVHRCRVMPFRVLAAPSLAARRIARSACSAEFCDCKDFVLLLTLWERVPL
jgi:hypothetical protein